MLCMHKAQVSLLERWITCLPLLQVVLEAAHNMKLSHFQNRFIKSWIRIASMRCHAGYSSLLQFLSHVALISVSQDPVLLVVKSASSFFHQPKCW